MANVDYSKFSDEELEKIASGQESHAEEPGLLKSIGKGYLNYAGGALRGMGQSIGDLGASAINWPISGIERLTGAHIPHIPHPHLINDNPQSLSESVGQILGQITGGAALPGGAALKTAQLANKGYKALRSGEELPLIGKLFSSGLGGAAEGALGDEENRGLGAALGFALGGLGQGVSSAIKFGRSIKSKNISKEINKVMDDLHDQLGSRFDIALKGGEESGANRFLKHQHGNIKLLKGAGENIPKEGEKHLTYALEQYNLNPTLTNAHYAQRDINKLVNKFSGATPGTKEEAAYKEALKIKNNLLLKISNAFEKSGASHHGEDYIKSREAYRELLGPYLNVPEIRALRRGDIRESKFADALLNKVGERGPQEQFMKKVGEKHPGLHGREIYHSVIKSPITSGAIKGAGAIAAGVPLTYAVAKALGLR